MSNKNQHFVSQAYLRWFGIPQVDAEVRAINLFAIGPRKVVQGASIKNQCSSDYFYGRNQAVENLLQFFEGRYGSAMASLNRGEVRENEIENLMQFLFLQSLRTSSQLDERLRLIGEFNKLEIGGERVREAMPPPDKVREIQQQLLIFAKEHSAFADLRPVFLINRTKVPFITSDNPAMFINRLYSQRYGDPTGGLIQSGGIATMPLTPGIALLAYDADVYQPLGSKSAFEVRRETDVDRLNELQVIRASSALFFQEAADADYVERLFDAHKGGRRTEWSVTRVFIRDGEDERFERFRRIRPEDQNSLEPRIQSMSPILPAPGTWPGFIKIKMRPKGWTNGTVIGFIREAHTNRAHRFTRQTLPYRLPRNHVEMEVMYERKRRPGVATR
jgi:hypothetical protein